MKPHHRFRILLFISAMITLFLCSCATKPTEKEIAWNYIQTHPTEFAEWSKERFPNVITKVIPGKKEIVYDSIFLPGEVIPCPEPTELNPTPFIKVPDRYIQTQSEKCTPEIIEKADGRDLQLANDKVKKAESDLEYCKNNYNNQIDLYNVLLDENKKLVNENSDLKVSKSTAWWITWILVGLISLFFIYRIFLKK